MRISRSPATKRTVWLVVLAGLVAWAGYLTLWTPKIRSIVALSTELEYAEEGISQGQDAVAEIGNWDHGFKSVFDREMEYALKLMPDKDDMPGLGVMLVELAGKHGLSDLIFDIRPREALESGEVPNSPLKWFRLPLRIQAVGSYSQLVSFAVEMERLERLVIIDEIHLERKDRIAPRLMCAITGFALVQEGWQLDGEEFASWE